MNLEYTPLGAGRLMKAKHNPMVIKAKHIPSPSHSRPPSPSPLSRHILHRTHSYSNQRRNHTTHEPQDTPLAGT